MSKENKGHDRKANFNDPLTLKLEYTFENIQLNVDDNDPSMKKILNNARKFGKQMREKMEVLYNENGYYAKRKRNILDFFQKKKGRQLTFRKLSFLNPYLHDVNKKEEMLLYKEKLRSIKELKKKLEDEKYAKIFNRQSKTKLNTIDITSINSPKFTNRTSRENSELSTDKRSKNTKIGLDSSVSSRVNLPSVRKIKSNKDLKASFIRQMSGLIYDPTTLKNSKDLNENLIHYQNKRFHIKQGKRPFYVSEEDLIPPVEIENLPFIYDENNKIKVLREKGMNSNDNLSEMDRFTKLNENSAFKHRDFLINKYNFIKQKEKTELMFNYREAKEKDSLPKIDLSSKVESILERTKSGKKKIFEKFDKKSEKMEILEKIRKEKSVCLSTIDFDILKPLKNKNKLKNNISC